MGMVIKKNNIMAEAQMDKDQDIKKWIGYSTWYCRRVRADNQKTDSLEVQYVC